MTHIEKIRDLDPPAVREYVREHLDESFVSEVLENKEVAVPVLIKNKVAPDKIVFALSKTTENALFLISCFKENNFIPGIAFVESLLPHGNDVVSAAIKAFPSIPYSTQFLMQLINSGCAEAAYEMTKLKAEFFKDDVVLRLLRAGLGHKELLDHALKSERLLVEIAEDIKEGTYHNYSYSPAILNLAYVETDIVHSPSTIVDLPLDARGLRKLCRYFGEERYGPEYKIEWRPEFEQLNSEVDIPAKLIITEVPEGSRFRERWVKHAPHKATREELLTVVRIEIAENPELVAAALLRQSLETVKAYNVDRLFNRLKPSKLAAAIPADSTDTILYLIEHAPTKFKNALRAKLPDELRSKAAGKKRSFFYDAFQSLQKGKIDSFRDALSGEYNINRFQADTYQSSKKKSCENLTLSAEILNALTKEEFLVLLETPFRFRGYYSSGEINLSFKLNVEEAQHAFCKLDEATCFDLCDDKVAFIKKVDDGTLSNVFNARSAEILKDKDLEQAFLSRTKKESVSGIDSDSIEQLAKVLTREELRKRVFSRKSGDYWESSHLVDVRCKDGQFLMSDEEVLALITSKYAVENRTFIENLMNRDRALAKKVVEAYLEGNKGLSRLTGRKIEIRRSDVAGFRKRLAELESTPEELINRIFETGQATLDDFKESITNWKHELAKFGNNRVIKIPKERIWDLAELEEIQNVRFEIALMSISLGGNDYYDDELPSGTGSIVVKAIKLETPSWHDDEADFTKMKSFLDRVAATFGIPVSDMTVDGDATDDVAFKLSMLMAGIEFNGSAEVLRHALTGLEVGNGRELTAAHFRFLDSKGLIVSDKLAEKIVEEYRENTDVIRWLVERCRNLSQFAVNKDWYSLCEEETPEALSLLKKAGVQALSEEDYEIYLLKKTLIETKPHFEAVDLRSLSFSKRIEMIRFIETEVDPSYVKLNLSTANLDTIDELLPYEEMRAQHHLEDSELVSAFNVPQNIATNKKIIKGLRDMVTLKGGAVVARIELLREAVKKINPNVDVNFSDLAEYTDPQNMTLTDQVERMSVSILQKIIEELDSPALVETKFFEGRDKKNIMRFIRSACDQDEGYVRDTLSGLVNVVQGVEALKERAAALIAEGDEDASERIKESIAGVTNRLHEIAAMDDIVDLHDRIGPLSTFLKSDPIQPLGQDKFNKLEKDKKVQKKLGMTLYFPKTREDLQYLGDENGWCVNYHRSYGDGVIQKGNILVGICEAGSEPVREKVVALAHFQKTGARTYHLEQLRWSSRKKEGSRNVDASDDFDHKAILEAIIDYLNERDREKGKVA